MRRWGGLVAKLDSVNAWGSGLEYFGGSICRV